MKVFLLLLFGLNAVRIWADPPVPPPPSVELPFPMGETLTYQIYWGLIAVGESKATTSWEWTEESGWLIRIRFRTVSNGVIAKLYPVDDVVDTYVDPVSLRPLWHRLDLQEGKNVRKSITVFDWERMQAVYTKFHVDKEDEVKTIPLEEGSRDRVSFMDFLRGKPFEDRKTYEFEVLSDYKMYDLTVRVDGTDQVKLEKYGRTESLKLLPEAEFEGVFVRSGKMRLWLSNDEHRLLTKLVLDTPFANVKLLLKNVEGPDAAGWEDKK
ncbi:MAG: DUF3108 domain-containing protein [Kiritimatiellia bacterium]